MIILQCSGEKAHGGDVSSETSPLIWTTELQLARKRVAAFAQMELGREMSAWRRYTGIFYQNCEKTLARAIAANANIVFISGGYGVVTATEPICWYNRLFKLSDWDRPTYCVENALLHRVSQTRPQSVIAFVSASGDYAKLVRKVPWVRARIPVHLVTRQVAQDGAMRKTPTALAKAFSAYWNNTPESAPSDLFIERLA
jgi:hypothetical protein